MPNNFILKTYIIVVQYLIFRGNKNDYTSINSKVHTTTGTPNELTYLNTNIEYSQNSNQFVSLQSQQLSRSK